MSDQTRLNNLEYDVLRQCFEDWGALFLLVRERPDTESLVMAISRLLRRRLLVLEGDFREPETDAVEFLERHVEARTRAGESLTEFADVADEPVFELTLDGCAVLCMESASRGMPLHEAYAERSKPENAVLHGLDAGPRGILALLSYVMRGARPTWCFGLLPVRLKKAREQVLGTIWDNMYHYLVRPVNMSDYAGLGAERVRLQLRKHVQRQVASGTESPDSPHGDEGFLLELTPLGRDVLNQREAAPV